MYDRVPNRIRSAKMVSLALVEAVWARNFGPNLNGVSLHEFLELWTRVSTWEPQLDIPNSVAWAWEPNGHFSIRSAYVAKF